MAVHVLGVGQVRTGQHSSASESQLAEQAVNMALLDAGLERRLVEGVFIAGRSWNQGARLWADPCDQGGGDGPLFPRTHWAEEDVAGAHALHLAWAQVRDGTLDTALVVGVGKTGPVASSHSGTDRELPDDPGEGSARGDRNDTVEPAVGRWASLARSHMDRYGTTQEQLAAISAKNLRHGALNPRICCQSPMSAEEILADIEASFPLTRAMCARPADGAAAVVLCSRKFLKTLGAPLTVNLLASEMGSETVGGEGPALTSTLHRAFEVAGVSVGEVNLAELEDLTAFGELQATEAMRLCAVGEGGRLAESGATSLGGRMPVNTSGGLAACGFVSGVSALSQLIEIVTQLRNQGGRRQVWDARIGLAVWGSGRDGGPGGATFAHVLQAQDP